MNKVIELPSYVSFSSTERLIGDPAKNSSPESKNTVYDVKRLVEEIIRMI